MAMMKTAEEIQAMREGGALLSRALQAAVDIVKPGVTIREINAVAHREIVAGGGKPSFLGYKSGGGTPFPTALCVSRNDEVVHGLGDRDIVLEAGDIVGLDIGCWYKGLCTDMAVTVPVGKISEEQKRLLMVTRDSMRAGVQAAVVGATVIDIGGAVEDSIDQKKYGIVRSLVGHGVGHAVHEAPHVPNYRGKGFAKTKLEPGMCLAIEPMITLGTDEVDISEDGWTIVTQDGADAAHFEVTIAITPEGPEVLTPEPVVHI